MTFFKNSKHFAIKGKPTFNNVRGDQINVNTLHYNGEIATKRTEYDEFEYVKRGDVITLKEICAVDIKCKRKNGEYHFRDRKTRMKVYSIELLGQQSTGRFTGVEYKGEEADEVWEEHFQKFSRDRDPNSWLLYGLNHSKVPMLIFHHDLIPLAHFYTESLWMKLYFWSLSMRLECSEGQIWADTSKGSFCVGPSGPFIAFSGSFSCSKTIIVPSTRDMLDTDTISSFFRQFKSKVVHQALINVASSLDKTHDCCHFLYPTLHPEASEEQLDLQSFFPGLQYEQLRSSLLGLRFDIVYSTSLDAVARWPQESMKWWGWWSGYGLVDRMSAGELARFTMCEDEICVYTHSNPLSRNKCWLSQFPRCVEEGRSEDYFFIEPRLRLVPESPREYDGLACFFKLCDDEIPPPIYLFLYPPPMTMSEIISWSEGRTRFHFWSLDENGQSEMTEDELEQWGIPSVAPRTDVWLISWDSSIYTTLYDWQVAHGFDPATADFARYLDLPELEILRPKEEKSSSWWEAIPGSGISAFGF